jgi:choloylglycine hydrolase
MPVKALTNNTYAESIGFLKLHRGFGGHLPTPKGNGSLERIVHIAKMIQEYDPKKSKDIVTYGFNLLSFVSGGNYTKWSIVYDLGDRSVYFHTWSRKKIKKIDLAGLDFSCKTPVKAVSINTGSSADITDRFSTYTYKMNKRLIRNTFGKTYFLEGISKDLLERVMHYPEKLKCE